MEIAEIRTIAQEPDHGKETKDISPPNDQQCAQLVGIYRPSQEQIGQWRESQSQKIQTSSKQEVGEGQLMTNPKSKVSSDETSVKRLIAETARDLDEKYNDIGSKLFVLTKACHDASQKLPSSDKKLLMHKIKFSKSEFSKFVSIGERHKVFTDPKISSKLPLGYTILYSLSKLHEDQIRKLADAGKIKSDMTLKEANGLRPPSTRSREKPSKLLVINVLAGEATSELSEKDRKALDRWIEEGRKLLQGRAELDVKELEPQQPTAKAA